MRADVEDARAGTISEGAPDSRGYPRRRQMWATRKATLTVSIEPRRHLLLRRPANAAIAQARAGPKKLEHEKWIAPRSQAFVSAATLSAGVEEAKAGYQHAAAAGYRIVWGGQFENQQRAAARLMIVLPIAVLMIFVVPYLTLRFPRAAAADLGQHTFAAQWGYRARAIGRIFVGSCLGRFHRAVRHRSSTAWPRSAISVSCANAASRCTRRCARVPRGALRPVLMTASTGFGLIPPLFAGSGVEIQRPLRYRRHRRAGDGDVAYTHPAAHPVRTLRRMRCRAAAIRIILAGAPHDPGFSFLAASSGPDAACRRRAGSLPEAASEALDAHPRSLRRGRAADVAAAEQRRARSRPYGGQRHGSWRQLQHDPRGTLQRT